MLPSLRENLQGYSHLHTEQGERLDWESGTSRVMARSYSPAAKLDRANELAASALAAYWGYCKDVVSAMCYDVCDLHVAIPGKGNDWTTYGLNKKGTTEMSARALPDPWRLTYNTPEKTKMLPSPNKPLNKIGTATNQQVEAWNISSESDTTYPSSVHDHMCYGC